MRVPHDGTNVAAIQATAARQLAAEFVRRGHPATQLHNLAVPVNGVPTPTGDTISGWRITTACFDGTAQVPLRDCVVTPAGAVFTIHQYIPRGAYGGPVPATLPVYGLLEGLMEAYETVTGAALPLAPIPSPDATAPPPVGMAEAAARLRPAGGIQPLPNAKKIAKDLRRDEKQRGLDEWDGINAAVREFVPLARKERGLPRSGVLRSYWAITLSDDGLFRFELRVHGLTGRWQIIEFYRGDSLIPSKVDIGGSLRRVPIRRLSAALCRAALTQFLGTGR